MKTLTRWATTALLVVMTLVALGGDKSVSTTRPQTTDDTFDLQLRTTAAMARLSEALLGYGSNQLQLADGGSGPACTNAITIATNAATPGNVWSAGIITNFFGAAGGVGRLNSITYYDASTNATPALDFFFFSRPPTTPTNNAAWGPTDAEMIYCIGKVSLATTDFTSAGANKSVGTKTVTLPVYNTYTNQNLYFVILAANGNTLSNAVTTHYVSFR